MSAAWFAAAKNGDTQYIMANFEANQGSAEQKYPFFTALMYAADAGNVRMVTCLRKGEAGKSTPTGWTALMAASAKGAADCVSALADLEAGMETTRNHDCFLPHATALLVAATSGHDDIVLKLYDREAGKSGWNSLFLNAYLMHYGDILKDLEACNATNSIDTWGRTPLMYLAMQATDERLGAGASNLSPDERKALRMLIKAFDGISDKYGKTALMYAAERGNAELVSFLKTAAEKELRRTMSSEPGFTALMLATEQGHAGVVEKLVGEEAMMANRLGVTALMLAVLGRNVACARILAPRESALRLDAPYEQFPAGTSPLGMANALGDKAMVQLLTDQAISPSQGGEGAQPSQASQASQVSKASMNVRTASHVADTQAAIVSKLERNGTPVGRSPPSSGAVLPKVPSRRASGTQGPAQGSAPASRAKDALYESLDASPGVDTSLRSPDFTSTDRSQANASIALSTLSAQGSLRPASARTTPSGPAASGLRPEGLARGSEDLEARILELRRRYAADLNDEADAQYAQAKRNRSITAYQEISYFKRKTEKLQRKLDEALSYMTDSCVLTEQLFRESETHRMKIRATVTRLAEVTHDRKETLKRCRELEGRIQALSLALKSSNDEVAALKQRNARLFAHQKEMEEQLSRATLNDQLEAKLQETLREKRAVEERLQAQTEHASALQARLEAQEGALAEAQAQMRNLSEEATRLTGELSQAQERLRDAESRSEALSQDLKAKTEEAESQASLVAALHREAAERKREHEQELERIANDAREAATRDATISLTESYEARLSASAAEAAQRERELQARADKLEGDLSEASAKSRSFEEAASRLRGQLQDSQQKLQEAQAALDAAQHRTQELSAERGELSGRLAEVSAALQEQRRVCEDQRARIKQGEQKLSALRGEAEASSAQLAEKEQALRGLSAQRSELQARLAEASEERERLSGLVEEMKADASRADSLAGERENALQDALQQVQGLEEEKASLTAKLAQQAGELEQRKHAAEAAVADVRDRAQRIAGLERDLAKATKSAENLSAQLQSTMEARTKAESELQAANTHLQELDAEVTSLRAQLADAAEEKEAEGQAHEAQATELQQALNEASRKVASLSSDLEARKGEASELERKLGVRDAQYRATAEECTRLKAEVADTRRQLNEAAEEAATRDDQLRKAQNERSALEETSRAQAARLEELQGRLEGAEAKLASQAQELRSQKARLADAEHAASTAGQGLRERQAEADRVAKELATVKEELDKRSQELQASGDRVLELESTEKRLRADAQALQARLDAKANEAASLAEKLAAKSEEQQGAANDLRKNKEALFEAELAKKHLEDEITMLTDKAEAQARQMASLQADLDHKASEADELAQRNRSLLEQKAAGEARQKGLRQELDKLQGEGERASQRISQLSGSLEAAEAERDSLSAKATSLASQLEERDEELSRLRSKTQDADQQLPQLRGELQASRAQTQAVQREKGELEASLKKLRETRDAAEERASKLAEESGSLASQLSVTQQERDEQAQRRAAVEQQLAELQEKQTALAAEKDRLQTEFRAATNAASSSRLEAKNLEHELAELRASHDKLIEAMQDNEEANNRLQENMSSLQDEYAALERGTVEMEGRYRAQLDAASRQHAENQAEADRLRCELEAERDKGRAFPPILAAVDDILRADNLEKLAPAVQRYNQVTSELGAAGYLQSMLTYEYRQRKLMAELEELRDQNKLLDAYLQQKPPEDVGGHGLLDSLGPLDSLGSLGQPVQPDYEQEQHEAIMSRLRGPGELGSTPASSLPGVMAGSRQQDIIAQSVRAGMEIGSYDDASLDPLGASGAPEDDAQAGIMTAEELASSMLDEIEPEIEKSISKLADSLVKTANELSTSLRLSQHAAVDVEAEDSSNPADTDPATAAAKEMDESSEQVENGGQGAAVVSI